MTIPHIPQSASPAAPPAATQPQPGNDSSKGWNILQQRILPLTVIVGGLAGLVFGVITFTSNQKALKQPAAPPQQIIMPAPVPLDPNSGETGLLPSDKGVQQNPFVEPIAPPTPAGSQAPAVSNPPSPPGVTGDTPPSVPNPPGLTGDTTAPPGVTAPPGASDGPDANTSTISPPVPAPPGAPTVDEPPSAAPPGVAPPSTAPPVAATPVPPAGATSGYNSGNEGTQAIAYQTILNATPVPVFTNKISIRSIVNPGSILNIRSGPGVEYDRIMQQNGVTPCHFVSGSVTDATGRANDTGGSRWYRIVLQQGAGDATWICQSATYGWVSHGWIEPVNSTDSLDSLEPVEVSAQ